jgi:putative ABC transport system substrate-binding protein
LVAAIAAWPRPAAAQAGARVPRVALVGSFTPADVVGMDPADLEVRAFLHGLRDLGLVDGKTVVVDRHSSAGRDDQLAAVMGEVVRQRVDVIVTTGGPAVYAATRATRRVPIVAVVDDVLDMGIIDSLARPGHNLTGFGENDAALHGKRLQMIKEVAPAVVRIAVLCYRQGAHDRAGGWRRALDAAGRALELQVSWLDVDSADDLAKAFDQLARLNGRETAIYATTTYVNDQNAARIADFALRHGMPSFGFPERGMLLGYWADAAELYRRAAGYVKKILDGAKPGELPFEQAARFDLVINARTAKALGLVVPRALLLNAQQVID